MNARSVRPSGNMPRGRQIPFSMKGAATNGLMIIRRMPSAGTSEAAGESGAPSGCHLAVQVADVPGSTVATGDWVLMGGLDPLDVGALEIDQSSLSRTEVPRSSSRGSSLWTASFQK
jgi:hypothetical protein